MAILKPDNTTTLNGVTVKEFLLTKHNPNKISMPTASMKGKVIGVTIHNTDDLANVYEDAEQYTRATYNGNMGTVRVHYYVDDVNAWQNLPLTLSSWHAADGSGNGNRRTISIECIMTGKGTAEDKKAEDNAARLAAALLKQHGLGINNLYTHTHWLNVRDGKTGTVDELNTMYHSYKMCPAYILPHWSEFKSKVEEYLNSYQDKPVSTNTSKTDTSTKAETTNSTDSTNTSGQMYRIRKSWDNPNSQIGAYKNLDGAKKACKDGYSVYDKDGNVVYSKTSYLVRVRVEDLNIRNGAGIQHAKTGKYTGKGVFTIVETDNGWGRLKMGGWISLNYTTKI